MNKPARQPLTGGVVSRTHRPFVWVCVSFILGIMISEFLRIPFPVITGMAALFLLLSLWPRLSRISTLFLLPAVVCLGITHAQDDKTLAPDHISRIPYYFYKDPVLIEGVVVSDVEPRSFFKGKKTVFSLEIARIKTKWGWKTKTGMILVNLFRGEDIKYGDYLRLEGKLSRPFNFSNESNFSYRDYLYRKGIMFILSVKKQGSVEVLKQGQGRFIVDLSFRLKRRLRGILEKYLPKGEAGIMQAFLLGDRYDIPKNIYDFFKLSGAAHIIAISGFNIGIVAYLIFLLLKMFPLPRQAQYVLAMVLLIFYAFLTGGQPPVVRATIMAVVFLASFLLEREQESVNTLSIAASILLWMNPLNLFDVGFQLSFISVLFIILFYPKLMDVFYKSLPGVQEKTVEGNGPCGESETSGIKLKAVRYLLQSTAISLSAYLGVAALVIYYFQLITPVVIVANLVIVPLASLIIFLGMGLLMTGMLFPFMAFTFAGCISLLMNFMVITVAFFVRMPFAYFHIKNITVWHVISYYAFIWAFFCLPWSWMFDKLKKILQGRMVYAQAAWAARMIDKERRVC
jgi:competence protein ComEC